MINLVISGGQTGADQAGLRAGKALGLATGGWVPLGCKTDDGPAPWLVTEYGCREHSSSQYAPRTIANVRWADGTLWFGDHTSPGGRLTIRTLRGDHRPHLILSAFISTRDDPRGYRDLIQEWLQAWKVQVLNIAGNRERTNPGIGKFVEEALIEALRP